MSKCRYDLSEDCNNKDCVKCVLDKIRAEIKEIIKLYEGSCDQDLGIKWGYEGALEIIDKYIKEGEQCHP